MKRFFIWVSAFTVFLSVFSVLLPVSNASAASQYDDVISVSTEARVSDFVNGQPCTEINQYNFALRWSEFLEQSTYDNGFDIDGTVYPTYYYNNGTSLNGALGSWLNRTHWALTNEGANQFRITWTTDENSSLQFQTIGDYQYLVTSPSPNTRSFVVSGTPADGSCGFYVEGHYLNNNGTSVASVTIPSSPRQQPVFINWPITYPPGYDGVFPPDTPPQDSVIISPSIFYLVDKKIFTFQNSFDLPSIFGSWSIDGLYTQIDWELQRWDEDQGTYNTVVSRRTTVMEKFTFNIDDLGQEYGQYRVQATFYTSGFVPEGFEYGTRSVTLPIDGSTYSGDTSQMDCEGLSCDVYEQSPYEDCTTFGLDIVGGIGCVFRNFGVWLVATLQWLFVPSDSFVAGWQRDTGNFLNQKLGFLYSSIGFVTGVFGSILSNAGTGTCTLSTPGTLFGAPVSFNMCSIQQVIGNTAWLAIQGIVISLTILLLAFAAYRKYLEVVDQR